MSVKDEPAARFQVFHLPALFPDQRFRLRDRRFGVVQLGTICFDRLPELPQGIDRGVHSLYAAYDLLRLHDDAEQGVPCFGSRHQLFFVFRKRRFRLLDQLQRLLFDLRVPDRDPFPGNLLDPLQNRGDGLIV